LGRSLQEARPWNKAITLRHSSSKREKTLLDASERLPATQTTELKSHV
jgi:hypothetical protein